jgi:multidrug resistance protein MdtO
MATLAQALPRSSGPLAWFRQFLKEELAPYPGRTALVARMTIAATAIMIITMTFRIPYAPFAAVYALTISRENPETSVKDVKTTVIGYALSALYILAGATFFLREPNLRLLWVIGTLFLLFYSLSAMASYLAVARFGYLLAITIPLWDLQIPLELKMENTLWAFGVMSLASVITVLVELVYAELKPGDVVLGALAERLDAVVELLDCYASGRAVSANIDRQLTRFALAGNSRLRRLLRRSGYSPEYREQMGAVVAHVGRLVDIAANMVHLTFELSDADKDRIRSLAVAVETIRSDLLHGRVPGAVETGKTEALPALPLFGEMEKTVSIIPEIFAGQHSLGAYTPSPDSKPAVRLFLPDALTNPEHIKFGLKGCLAASLCYLIYNGKAWPGISTAVTTCVVTGLSTIGSSRQKQVLRIGGAVAGVTMAVGAEVFVLPGLDSIAGFTLVFIVVTSIAAWFATSSPRLSYFGNQVALAFYLINLNEFAVQTSLIPARDRIVGILLGLTMMWLFFDQLWSSPAASEMKRTLISNLRLLAQFAREPVSKDRRAAIETSYSLRETINNSFDRVRASADGVLFEFGRSRDQNLALRERIVRWQPPLRMLFLTQIATWKYRIQLPGFELPEPVATEQREFDYQLARALGAMADRLEGGSSDAQPMLEESLARLERAVQAYPPGGAFAGRFQALLSLDRRIESSIVSMTEETRRGQV